MSTEAPGSEAALREHDRREWRRHPGDAARLVFRLGALVVVLGITALTPEALSNASADLVRLLAQSPAALRDALVGLAQLTALALPLLVLGSLLLRRRLAEALMITVAAIAGGAIMSQLIGWLDRAAPPQEIAELPSDWIIADFPSVSYVAALVAGSAVASPLLRISWRRVLWVGVGAAVLVQLFTATHAPVNLAVTVALGGVIGSAILVAVGSPRRRPGAASLREALERGGLVVEHIGDEAAQSWRRTYTGTSRGRPVVVAYLDRDDRDADLLARFLRSLRVRSVDDRNLSTRPGEAVDHEALLTLMAGQAGASVPEVLAVVPGQRDRALIAFSAPAGRPLGELDTSAVSDPGLDDLWGQLAALHRARIAHRSLTPDRILLDGDHASLLGLENARSAATDAQIGADVAQLLVLTTLVVGVERAVDSATRVMPETELEAALPLVQLAALPSETRKTVRGQKGKVDELRQELQDRLGLDEIELTALDRISLMRIVSWVGFAVLAFFILTLLSGWDDIVESMKGVDWAWVPWVLVATLAGTVGGAMSLSGSVLRKVPLGEAVIVMFGQSFLNRFTPANAGGMAMRIRYLQKGGTDVTVATAAIGLTSAASGVLQVLFIAFFFLWSGSDPTSEVDTPDPSGPDGTIVLVFVFAILAAVIALAVTPRLRTWAVEFVRSTIDKIRSDFGELARRPAKLGLLFGGAGVAKMATIVAFALSCRAFGIDLSFAELGALYLGASTVAAAVPTPGGVGAIEAALVLVLGNAGVDDATAWAAVLLFRLINYWLITIPGYIALKLCERMELV